MNVLLLALVGVALAGARGVVEDLPPPPGMAEAYAPRRVALVVGIDTYRDPALGSLRFAAKDAHDVATVLSDPAAGDFDVVSEVSGSLGRAAFWQAFDAVASTLHRDDTFFVYIAAHGTMDLAEGTALYLMPTDGLLARPAQTGIALADIEAALGRVPARRRVLALDACHTGQGRSRLSPEVQARLDTFRGPIPPPIAAAVSASELRLYSAHLNQPALEDANLQNGVYTHFLVKALAGAGDLDGDGLVEAMEAHHVARDKTLAYTGGTQVPWMEAQLVGREAVYLAGDPSRRKDAEKALITGLEALPARAVITVDGAVRGAEAVSPGVRGVTVSLDDRVLVERAVRVRAGHPLDVGSLVADRARRWSVDLGVDARGANAWVPTWGTRLGTWWQPADPRGGRLALGASAALGLGGLPAGDARAQVGWWWGSAWQVGPTLGVGWLWRVAPTTVLAGDTDVSLLSDDEKVAQGAPVGAVGGTLRRALGAHTGLSLDPGLLFFSTVEGTAWFPSLTASATASW